MQRLAVDPRVDEVASGVVRTSLVVVLGVIVAHGCATKPPTIAAAPDPPPPSVDAGLVVDRGRWATATDSAFSNGAVWHHQQDFQCLADLGCPAPAHIPTCEPGVNGIAVRDIGQHRGERVQVRGKLLGSVVELQGGCQFGCCRSRGNGNLFIDYGLTLVDHRLKHAFECGGDSSMTCCGFEIPKSDVVASGLLEQDGVSLSDVSLCSLRPGNDGLKLPECSSGSSEVIRSESGWNCACYGGQSYCEFLGGCFRAGRWFEEGAERPVSRSCARCICRGHDWECELRACASTAMDFPLGSSEISEAQAERWNETLFSSVVQWGMHAEISGFALPTEKPALANERAQNAAKIAKRYGVSSSDIEIRGRGSYEPGPSIEGPRQSRERGRVEIRIFEAKLPEPMTPTPPAK